MGEADQKDAANKVKSYSDSAQALLEAADAINSAIDKLKVDKSEVKKALDEAEIYYKAAWNTYIDVKHVLK